MSLGKKLSWDNPHFWSELGLSDTVGTADGVIPLFPGRDLSPHSSLHHPPLIEARQCRLNSVPEVYSAHLKSQVEMVDKGPGEEWGGEEGWDVHLG